MKYYVWYYKINEDDAIITKMPKALDGQWWQLCKGLPCKDWFPPEISFELNSSCGRVINDAIHSTFSGCHFISENLRIVLIKEGINFEAFPIKIRNHNQKLLKEPFYLLNILDFVDCVNRDESEFDIDPFDVNLIDDFEKLTLNYSEISDDHKIFRLTQSPRMIIVREDIAVQIKKELSLTGPNFMNVEDWDGYGD